MTTAIPVESDEFERTATACRWSDRSLAVARAVLVGRTTVPQAAQSHAMSANHARVLVGRFIEKIDRQRQQDAQERVEAFRQREQPLFDTSELEPFADELRKLWSLGYQPMQLVDFLAANGVITNPATVSRFIRSSGA